MRKMEFIDDIQKCIPQIDAENGKYQLPEVGITSLQLMRLQNRWKKKGYNVKFKDLANSRACLKNKNCTKRMFYFPFS